MKPIQKFTNEFFLAGLAGVLLVVGTWGPGLWDPWEMNRAHVARRMAEAPRVLVMEARPRGDAASLAARLATAMGEDAEVASSADRGQVAAPLEAGRTFLADHVFAVAVLDVDGLIKDGDEASVKRLAGTLGSLARQNPSTTFLWVSGSGVRDPAALLDRVLAAGGGASPVMAPSALPEDSDDAEVARSELERLTRVLASPDDLEDAVRGHLGGDAFLAQFKSRGWTAFVPPLDPFLVSLSLRAFGMNEFAARLPGVVWGVLLLGVLAAFARRTFGEREAALVVLVALTSSLFYLSARFVDNEMSVMLGLALGVAALHAGSRPVSPWWHRAVALPAVSLFLYLSGGMTAIVTFAAIAVAWPVVLAVSEGWSPERRPAAESAAITALCAVGLALLTFLPDAAFFRAFRFTAATFAGGMRSDARSFDFILKEVGFGLFPWSALLPVAVVAVFGGERVRPERLLVLMWAVAPLAVAMITIRPMNQTLYAGAPALAVLLALYVREAPDDASHGRLLAFFGFGWFLVMMKDVVLSPAPLVSFLTTDPMFSEPGKGELPFPPDVKLPLVGLAGAVLAGAAILAGGGRLLSATRAFPGVLRRGRTFLVVVFALVALIVADIAIFLALKWETLTAAGPEVARGAVLARILLTGPDIAALYLLLGVTIAARHSDRIGAVVRRGALAGRIEQAGRAVLGLERPAGTFVVAGVGAFALFVANAYVLVPRLSHHLSQKHIIETYQASSARVPGDLFRHGAFAARGAEDSNFYTGQVPEMSSRVEVVDRLLDKARRTFFIVPKAQWSDLNHAFRERSKGRQAHVLDDRSSRFILVASSLAEGEADHNWIAAATLTESGFKALPGVTSSFVNFDNKIELVGYSLSSPAVRRGGKVTIRMYFKSTGRLTTSYRVFMHVDRVGSSSRIHGDHFVLNLVRETEDQKTCQGCFATNHWIPGDVVVDTYDLDVPIGSPSGPHHIWVGFYNPSGDGRLPVKDYDKTKVRHDGQNRVSIGMLTVE